MKSSGSNLDQYVEIGRRIKFYRESAGVNQTDLSKAIGFKTPSAIVYIEQGKRRVKVFDLVAIAKVVGVTVDMLIYGNSSDYKVENKEYTHDLPVDFTTVMEVNQGYDGGVRANDPLCGEESYNDFQKIT